MFLFIITYYDVRFIVRDGCIGLRLLVPQYGYLVFLTCFYSFRYMLIPVFSVRFYPHFPCICWNVVGHPLCHVFLCAVLLPILGMLMWCGLLSHKIVDIVCICYVVLCCYDYYYYYVLWQWRWGSWQVEIYSVSRNITTASLVLWG